MQAPVKKMMRINQARQLAHLLVSQTLGALCGSGSRRTMVVIAVVAGCTTFSPSAKASCGRSPDPKIAVVLPDSQLFGARRAMQPLAQLNLQANSQLNTKDNGNASITGLWDAKFFLPDGTLFDEGFDQWHSDGTEILNDNQVPPAAGNVCLGVFKQTGHRTFILKHPIWNYDVNGNLLGTIILAETITVGKDGNSYQGSFTFDVYDLSGNLIDHLIGRITAERITAD